MSPYTEHLRLPEPNENEKLWRYFDIPKFLSMLDTKSLYFTHPSIFRKHYDKYEGEYSDFTLEQAYKMTSNDTEKEKIRENYQVHKKTIEPFLTLNCWHRREKESARADLPVRDNYL